MTNAKKTNLQTQMKTKQDFKYFKYRFTEHMKDTHSLFGLEKQSTGQL